jgi:hypothetical protein
MAAGQTYQGARPDRPATGVDWEVLSIHRVLPPSTQTWHVGAFCTASVDPGVTAELRLRSSVGGIVSAVAPVTGYARNLRLGYQGISPTDQLIYVEGRVTSGVGGVRLEATPAVTIVSLPPSALISGGPPIGGGVSDVTALVTMVGSAGAQTITSPAFNPPANSRLVVAARAERGNHLAAFTWTVTDTGSLGTWQADATGPVEPGTTNPFARSQMVRSLSTGPIPPTGVTVTVDAWSTTDVGQYALVIFALPDAGASWLRQVAFGYGGTAVVTATLSTPPAGRPVAVFFATVSGSYAWLAAPDTWQIRGQVANPAGIGATLLAANSDVDGAIAYGTNSGSPIVTQGIIMDTATSVATATDVAGTYISPTSATSQTITAANIVGAAVGNKILILAAAPGPTEVATVTWTPPASAVPVFNAPGSGFKPRLVGYAVDYTSTTSSWTIAASTGIRAAAVALRNCGSLVAGSPVSSLTPTDPTSVANDANSVGLAITAINFTIGAVTAPPTGHTTILTPPLDVRQIYVASRPLTAAGTYDPAAATVGPNAEDGTAIAVVARPTVGTGGVPAPTIPAFSATVTLGTLGADIAAAVAAQPVGTHFQLIAGTYTNWSNVRPKTGQYFRAPASGVAVLEGTGKAYAFRAIDATGSSDNVVIGGVTGGIKIQNYGSGTARSEYGAIQAQPTDTVNNEFTYGQANNWFVHGVILEKNSANGLRMSDNCTVYQVTSYGHTVTGIGADRSVGGLVHTCTLEANGLNPSTGVSSNGAQAKFTFHNADEGRTSIVPSARAKAPLIVANTTMNATRSGISGSGKIGVWFDLDCQLFEVNACTVDGHSTTSIFAEGCNNGIIRNNAVSNSNGFGPAFGSDFINGAICCGESTNMLVEGNTLTSCDYALVNRMSNRSGDWYNSNNASFVNVAWPTALGGVRYFITADGPTPIPAPTARSNMWTGNNIWRNNTLVSCLKVVINEGSNGGGMNTIGSTPLASIHYTGNNYAGSGSILFFDRSNTGISLAAWKALPNDRDQ